MDPRPSRRADHRSTRCVYLVVWSQWILGRVVALTPVYTDKVLRTYASQWILGRVVALTGHSQHNAIRTVVSMDPRPSRRADKEEKFHTQWENKSQWILGRVVALTGIRMLLRVRTTGLNGSSAESSR